MEQADENDWIDRGCGTGSSTGWDHFRSGRIKRTGSAYTHLL